MAFRALTNHAYDMSQRQTNSLDNPPARPKEPGPKMLLAGLAGVAAIVVSVAILVML